MPRKEPRNYKAEYRQYHGKREQINNRNQRNKAVRLLGREGKGADNKEVDHIKGSKQGSKLNNSSSNLRVVSRKVNRRKG